MKIPAKLRRYAGTRSLGWRERGEEFSRWLYEAFGGNATAAADFLGFARGHSVTRRWQEHGFVARGRDIPRRGRRWRQWADELDVEELDRRYRQQSRAEEHALRYRWQLPRNAKVAVLVPICDVHLGHRACDYDRFARLCEWIARHKHVRWFVGGDLFDLVVTGRPGRPSEQFCSPDEAYQLAVYRLAPIASQCIGIGSGNHDERLVEVTGSDVNLPRHLATELGVPFLGYDFHIVYELVPDGRREPVQRYVHYHHHGWGGGRTEGSAYNKLRDLMSYTTAELVTMAHLHREGSSQKIRRGPDPEDETGLIREQAQVGILLPSFLRWRGYMRRAGLPPNRLGVSAIHLDVEEHSIHVRQ